MAKAECDKPPAEVVETDMMIVGGGICGILAAKMCADRRWPYVLVERNPELGGVWTTLANRHSYLQCYEPNYRWDDNYRINQDVLTKGSAIAVNQMLKRYAYDNRIDRFTRFRTEVVTVRHQADGSFLTICKCLETGKISHIRSQFVMVTPGILGQQFTAEERGVKDVDKFKNVFCYGGKKDGVDCALGNMDLTGKNVVIMGTGSFALEAMEAAGRNNAKHITLVSRPRKRWVMPFSRQHTLTALSFMPLVPWALKVKFVQWWLKKFFFNPVGLGNMPPTGPLDEQDWAGQCNDGIFRLAGEGRLKVIIGKVDRLESKEVVVATEEGETVKLPADAFCCAAGCRYNLNPSFLEEMGIGFGDLHNYCFLGRNPRIGTASDFVFAYVPFGPQKQLEMFFHSAEQIKLGREKEILKIMTPTPLGATGETNHKGGRMAGYHTWFAYRSIFSTVNLAMEVRFKEWMSIMDVGSSWGQRLAMRAAIPIVDWLRFFICAKRGLREICSFPVWGKGVKDHYHPPEPLLRGEKKTA